LAAQDEVDRWGRGFPGDMDCVFRTQFGRVLDPAIHHWGGDSAVQCVALVLARPAEQGRRSARRSLQSSSSPSSRARLAGYDSLDSLFGRGGEPNNFLLCLSYHYFALEVAGRLGHVHVEGFLGTVSYREPAYLVGVLGIFAVTSIVTVYLTSSIAERLRRREDQLSTLYMGAQAVSSSLDLATVLNRLVEATAEAMGVSAASIGLRDPTGAGVEVAAAHGMSASYLSKGPILLEKSRVYSKVLSSGRPLIVQGEVDRSRFQYPDEKEKEGIRSILYVPLIARNRTLGIVRAHSSRPNRFTEDDARFLTAIAAQGGVAIENAMAYQALKKLDLDKSQFVRSVTHELRSPVTGAQSLLRGVIKGYAGGLTDRQQDILKRLNRRLNKLEALINDLLDLAAGRSDLKVEDNRSLALMDTLDRVIARLSVQLDEKEQ